MFAFNKTVMDAIAKAARAKEKNAKKEEPKPKKKKGLIATIRDAAKKVAKKKYEELKKVEKPKKVKESVAKSRAKKKDMGVSEAIPQTIGIQRQFALKNVHHVSPIPKPKAKPSAKALAKAETRSIRPVSLKQRKSNNTMLYGVTGVVVIGGIAWYMMKK